MTWLVPILFFVVALLYSMAGFGGGSSYIALLVVAGFPVSTIPLLALLCNLLVSAQGSALLLWRGHIRPILLLPLLSGSMPAAFMAGSWRIEEGAYFWILAFGLTGAGLALCINVGASEVTRRLPPIILLFIGVLLGSVAGLSGIGGGIFLSPVLHLLRADKARQIAGTASIFIALNSLMGLLGQLTKGPSVFLDDHSSLYWLCPLAVLLGGQLGSRTLSTRLTGPQVRRVTGFLVLAVAARLWWGIFAA